MESKESEHSSVNCALTHAYPDNNEEVEESGNAVAVVAAGLFDVWGHHWAIWE
jgi:hypothetical protein